jgi:hypothetical protein
MVGPADSLFVEGGLQTALGQADLKVRLYVNSVSVTSRTRALRGRIT